MDAAIRRLIKTRVIRRLRYGVYIDAKTRGRGTKKIAPMSALPKGPRARKIIDLLHQPRLPRELHEAAGISRQGVHKILGRLLTAGKVKRRKVRGRNQYAYVWQNDRLNSSFVL